MNQSQLQRFLGFLFVYTKLLIFRALKNDSVVAGGGAIEMELSKELRNYAKTIHGTLSFYQSFNKALRHFKRISNRSLKIKLNVAIIKFCYWCHF